MIGSRIDAYILYVHLRVAYHTGGGIGRLVADWIINGKSGMDITGMNIDRLHTFQVIILVISFCFFVCIQTSATLSACLFFSHLS